MMKSSRKIILLFLSFFICNANTFAKANETYDKLKLVKDVMELISCVMFQKQNLKI